MKKKLTKLEKQLLDLLSGVTFYSGHNKHCSQVWNHNYQLECDCKEGQASIRANSILNKYGIGFYQSDADKLWLKNNE